MDALVKVATVSMISSPDPKENLAKAIRYVEEAASMQADWVMLPEVFYFAGSYDQLPLYSESQGGPVLQKLMQVAQKNNIVLFSGTLGELGPEAGGVQDKKKTKVYNTLYVIGRSGELLGKYRKIHLFNLKDAESKPIYCESDGFLSGDKIETLMIDGFRVGLTICYDLRFPGLYTFMNRQDLHDVFVLPSAFTKSTGEAHWEVLLRARAIENQAYMFSANLVGKTSPTKECYGHGMVVDPWGVVLCDTLDQEGIGYAYISSKRIAEVRATIPALANQRWDLYS